VGDAGEGGAREAHDPEAGRVAHPADLVVPPLRDGDLEPGLVFFVADEARGRGERRAVVELDSLAPPIEVLRGHQPLDLHDVRLRDGAARVEQTICKRAVVRGEDHAARRKIEPADRVHSAAEPAEHLAHGGTAFRIAQRGDHVFRLVEDVVDEVLGDEALAIDLDLVLSWIGLRAELGHDPTVDPDSAGEDELFRGAARGDARACDDLLQSVLVPGASLARSGAARSGAAGGFAG
jgi:hypothetical protein